MNCVKRIKNKLKEFFYKESLYNTDAIAFFRISIGGLILIHFISIWSDFDKLFGKYGIIPWDIPMLFADNFFVTLPEIITFLEKYKIQENVTIVAFKYAFILFSVFVIVGFLTRFSSLVLFLLYIAYIKGNLFYAYGIDGYAMMALSYLIIFPFGRQVSIDNYLFKRRNIEKPLPNLFIRVLQIHLSISYFFSGFDKLLGFNWRNGESIWKTVHLPYANNDYHINFDWMAHYTFVPIIIGWSTIIIEMLYPLFISISITRKTWLFLIILLHFGIAIVLNLYFFSTMLIVWNVSAFNFDSPRSSENLLH